MPHRVPDGMGADVAPLYRPLAPPLMRFLNRAIVPPLEGARDLAVTRATSAAGDQ
ncbi:hypothetical protein [Mycobacteroides saopaulense]|uniref:hypothetical protein n=1 Tax=Mycobacteroides saopaulense TaxID=1578165 RepID=UPI0012FFC85C|nr:hypothetical protein [Mycobacteroides saopaulense]